MSKISELPISAPVKIKSDGWVTISTKGIHGFTDKNDKFWRWEDVDEEQTLSGDVSDKFKDEPE